MRLFRLVAPLAVVLLAACAAGEDAAEAPMPDLGDFRLDHNIVVGKTARMVPPSRSATPEEWVAVLTDEIGQRMGRHQGSGRYHLGVSVDAYALAVPGVPVVVKPRSALAYSVTVWDDATGGKINTVAAQRIVFEDLGVSGDGVVGSGLTRTKEEQMRRLAHNAALSIEEFLVENRDWFSEDPAKRAAAREDAAKRRSWRKDEQPN